VLLECYFAPPPPIVFLRVGAWLVFVLGLSVGFAGRFRCCGCWSGACDLVSFRSVDELCWYFVFLLCATQKHFLF